MKKIKFKKQPQPKISGCFTRADIEKLLGVTPAVAKDKIKEWYRKGYLKFAGRVPITRIDGVKIKIPAYVLTPLGEKRLTEEE